MTAFLVIAAVVVVFNALSWYGFEKIRQRSALSAFEDGLKIGLDLGDSKGQLRAAERYDENPEKWVAWRHDDLLYHSVESGQKKLAAARKFYAGAA